MGDVALRPDPPPLARVAEGEVPPVPERRVPVRELRVEPLHLPGAGPALELGDAGRHVAVEDVPGVAVGDQEVLVPVQVDVEEGRGPGPVRRVDAGVPGHLREAAVPPVEEEGVPLHLGPVPGDARRAPVRPPEGDLEEAPPEVAALHLGGEGVDVAVPVDVGEVHRHGGVRRLPEGVARRRPEGPVALVDPEPVRVVEVVADVQVRAPVAVHVVEARRQAEVRDGLLQGAAVLVAEGAVRPRHRLEAPRPVVQVQAVGLRLLDDDPPALTHLDPVVVAEPGGHHRRVALLHDDLTLQLGERALEGAQDVAGALRLVGGAVEVQVAVPVHVGQRRGRASEAPGEPGVDFREAARAVVAVDHVGPAEGGHHQIEVAVPVDVGRRRPGGVAAGRGHPRAVGDLLELPAAQVPVEGVRALEARQVDVGAPVAVEVAEGHARPDEQMLVVEGVLGVHPVRELDAGARRRQGGEPAPGLPRDPELPPPVAVRLVPLGRGGRARHHGGQRDREPGEAPGGHGASPRLRPSARAVSEPAAGRARGRIPGPGTTRVW